MARLRGGLEYKMWSDAHHSYLFNTSQQSNSIFVSQHPNKTLSRQNKITMSSADDQYEQQNDATGGDVPAGDSMDNDYKSRTGQYEIPVQKDDAPVNDPIDPATADSDEMLGMY